jgi:CheY-like chemotaxis protein
MALCRLPCTRSSACSSCRRAAKGLAFRFEADRRTARGGARRRKAAAPDPHQPAGQRGQVHRARAGHLARPLCARDGPFRDRRHRPRHLLSADDLARIFEPFARGSAATQAAPGAGLGLTIAKMLTDLMGGELSATSTPGQGSVFRVKLFLPEVHQAAAAAGKPAARRPRPARLRRARAAMLVVDNEEADRELLVHLLEPLGFELRTAASGHDCLDLLAAGYQPDAIFMDLAMPGIDGWETIRRLRAHRAAHARRSPSSRPTPSTRGWTTTSASAPRTSSSSRCATPSCWTGWSASSACAGWSSRPAPVPAADSARARLGVPARRAECAAGGGAAGLLPRHLNQLDEMEAASLPAPPGGRAARAGAAVPVRGHGPAGAARAPMAEPPPVR